MRKLKLGTRLASVLAAVLLADSGVSQVYAALDEIIVTARKRNENLQRTPLSMTAFTGADLNKMSIQTVGDIVDYARNVSRSAGPTGGSDALFFIRGVGQVDTNPALDPGVGVYIDDVYLGRAQGASFDLLDIARVEVLRGPQGTLFGRNTIGGAISVVTTDPGEEFGVKGKIAIGERERRDAYVSVNIPIAEGLGAAISGYTRSQDGWGKNFYTGDTYGDTDSVGGRIKVVWEASPDLTFKLAGDMSKGDGSPIPIVLNGFNPLAGNAIPGTSPLGVPFPADLATDVSSDPYTTFMSSPPINDTEAGGVSLSAEWDLGAVSLKSITAYRETEQLVHNDFDGTGYKFFDNISDLKQDQFSQEFQLSGLAFNDRLDWLVGGYYFEEDSNHNNVICMGTNAGASFLTAINFGTMPPTSNAVRNDGRCLQNNQLLSLDITSWAAFAHGAFDVTDKLTAVAGLRYTDEEKDQSYDVFIDNSDGIYSFFMFPIGATIPTLSPDNLALTIPTQYQQSWTELTPKVGLNYQATDDVMLYASYAKGFKSGGFSGRPSAGPGGVFAAVESYDPETVQTYEIGIKSEFADNRVRLNAAAFFSEYEDIQLLVLDPVSGFFESKNAGNNEIKGVELELIAEPIPELDLMFSAGWLDDEYTEINTGAFEIDPGDHLPVTPEWTLNAGIEYTIDMANNGDLALRADYNYRSDVTYNVGNNPGELQDGFGLLNLRATYTLPNDNISLAVFGLNVTDETYFSNAIDSRSSLGVAFAGIGAPSEWGVELAFDF